MNNAGEQLLSEVVVTLFDLFPAIDANAIKNQLSKIVSKYEISLHPDHKQESDVLEKSKMFIASKRVEGLSDRTLSGYEMELRLFAKKVDKRVENISSADIRVYLGELTGVKMSTVGKKLNALKSFFGFLAGEEIVLKDPTTKIKQPKEEKRLPKALNIEDLELLRESCETPRQRAVLEVMYSTGCRLSEVLNMKRSDINWQDLSCRVIGKGNKERIVYLSVKANFHLKKYLNARNDEIDVLITTQRKPYRKMSSRAMQDEINKIYQAATCIGVTRKVTPHVMRHTFATLTLNNGADLVAVQELLGHTSPDTTLRYARITEERKHEQHRKFLVQ